MENCLLKPPSFPYLIEKTTTANKTASENADEGSFSKSSNPEWLLLFPGWLRASNFRNEVLFSTGTTSADVFRLFP